MQAAHLNQIAAFARGLNAHIERALQAAFARSPSELTALVSIQNCDQFHIGWLAETLGVEHSSAVRVADRLERDGLIARLARDSQKKVGLRISAEGSALAKSVLAARAQATGSYLQVLDAQGAAALAELARCIIADQTSTVLSLYRHCALCDEDACANCSAGTNCN